MAARNENGGGMLTARYFAVKRFAVHDGPGVRTTLFLKGCSLRCAWCHNPEGIASGPELAFHEMKCSLCGACARVCRNHRVAAGRHDFDRAGCSACGKCVGACPSGALELFGMSITVAEAAKQLLADKVFYSEGGGVTVSGGEPLLQSGFCAALFGRLKRAGVHCAADTSGNVPWSAFEQILPVTDMFLYDLKAADEDTHLRYTGCGNRLILDNLRRLDRTGREIEVRMPLVPGVNMDDGALRCAGELLAPLENVKRVRLLGYHDFARSKYRAIGAEDTMPHVAQPDEEALRRAAAVLEEYDLEVTVQ